MATEGFILDPNGSSPLDLVSGTQFGMAALTIPPAARRPEWATSGDADGAELVREPYYEDRKCSMQLRVAAGLTMTQAMGAIGTLEGKLQEAIKLAAGGGDGLQFLWTPANASTGLTGYIKLAEITDLPVEYSAGWFQARPLLTVAFTAKPFLYGSEVTGPTATDTKPLVTVEVGSVPGDVPAEARLVITDGSSQARRWVEWGLEQRYYSHASPSSLLIDSEDLVTTGFAGTLATRTGGYRRAGATHDTISATLYTKPLALCGTGSQPHVGTFRVKARVWAGDPWQYFRLTWQAGDAPFRSNDWAQVIVGNDFSEVDLGIITIEAAATGTQKWTGRIEAYDSISTIGQTGEIDYLMLFPVEKYGRLEAATAYVQGVLTAFDDFTSTTAGSALNARTAPLGGAWATSGATTDFTFADGPGSAVETITRATTSDAGYRFAILGTATPTDTEVGAAIQWTAAATEVDMAVVARWTDANNHLRLRMQLTANGVTLVLESVIAGSTSTITSTNPTITLPANAWTKLRLVVYATGHATGWLLDATGATLLRLDTLSSVLATGGTLASGKVGVADRNSTGASTRYYDSFYAAAPGPESVIINPGESLQVRSDSNLRQSADGTTYGDIASRGSRFFIPQAGDPGRYSRVAVRATREDPITMVSGTAGDSMTLAVFYTPRYLAVPR